MTKYRVEYNYYQYNSGLADNGHKWGSVTTDSFEQAHIIRDKINFALDIRDKEEEYEVELPTGDIARDIEDEFIPYHGYFTGRAKIVEITFTERYIP